MSHLTWEDLDDWFNPPAFEDYDVRFFTMCHWRAKQCS